MELVDLAKILPADGRILGLDVGTKTIGVAVGTTLGRVATSVETICRTKFTRDAQRLRELIGEHEAMALVIGLPLHMDGSESRMSQSVKDFARNVDEVVDNIYITFHDERLSTQTVDDFLVESVDMSREKRARVVDKLAAQRILQQALEFISEFK